MASANSDYLADAASHFGADQVPMVPPEVAAAVGKQPLNFTPGGDGDGLPELHPSIVVEIKDDPPKIDLPDDLDPDGHQRGREMIISGRISTEEDMRRERLENARHQQRESDDESDEEPVDEKRFPRLALITGFLRNLVPRKGKQ